MSSKLSRVSQHFLPRLWAWYLSGTIFFILTITLTLWVPRLVQRLVDSYLERGPHPELIKTALAICLIGFLVIFIRTASRVFLLWAGRLVEGELKDDYFSKILYFTQRGLESFPVGDLLSRMSTDMRQVGFLFGFGSVQIMNFTLTGAYVVYCMAQIHGGLTFWVMVPITANTIILRLISPKLFAHARKQQGQVAELSGHISEAFHHVHALRSEGAIGSFYKIIHQSNQELYKANVRQSSYRTVVVPSLHVLTGLAYVVVFFYGGHLVLKEAITLGQLTAFNAYIAILGFPVIGIGLFVAARQRAKTACLRLEELDELPAEASGDDHSSTLTPSSSTAALELSSLSFRYPGKQKAVLSELNLSLSCGEHFGIVGEIGSGKTTLFKLLLGFYPPDQGEYHLFGESTQNLSLETLRATLGWVGQDSHFFSESIRYNLWLGSQVPGKDAEKRMIWACRQAAIYDEIMDFPQDFESTIGEDGLKLSGGQKQRLSLARALLHPRKIYLLDDIFSALDHSTEERIIGTLSSLNVTLMMVSHRPSVLKFCQRVAILEQGRFSHVDSYENLKDHPLLKNPAPRTLPQP